MGHQTREPNGRYSGTDDPLYDAQLRWYPPLERLREIRKELDERSGRVEVRKKLAADIALTIEYLFADLQAQRERGENYENLARTLKGLSTELRGHLAWIDQHGSSDERSLTEIFEGTPDES